MDAEIRAAANRLLGEVELHTHGYQNGERDTSDDFADDILIVARYALEAVGRIAELEAEANQYRRTLNGIRMENGHLHGCWLVRGGTRCSPECAEVARVLAAARQEPAPEDAPRSCQHCEGNGRRLMSDETCVFCEGTGCANHTMTVDPSCRMCRIA